MALGVAMKLSKADFHKLLRFPTKEELSVDNIPAPPLKEAYELLVETDPYDVPDELKEAIRWGYVWGATIVMWRLLRAIKVIHVTDGARFIDLLDTVGALTREIDQLQREALEAPDNLQKREEPPPTVQ